MTPLAAAATGAMPPSTAAPPAGGAARPCVDETAEMPDSAVALAAEVASRAELSVIAAQGREQQLQARLDRMRAEFNAKQERRSERMREMNMLRDMAMEQAKADDEILKKYIAMI